jgi:NAD(P)-dependent dehydrogenase (short-subunit alcohol dehydrogenase family)
VDLDLAGRTFVSTGAARGIGAATVRLAAREGANVVIADLLDEPGEALAKEIRENGGQATYVRCDVTVPDQIEALMAAAAREYGGIDVLHNNAGITDVMTAPTTHSLATMTPETWDRIQAVNLRGPFLCAKYAVPYLRNSPHATIVNAASIATWVARPNTLAYGASKAGIASLTRNLALELAPYRIRVNAYGPGATTTELVDAYYLSGPEPEKARAAVAASYLVDRLGETEDIANVVCFLASPRSAFINGAVIPVDGGYLAWRGRPDERPRGGD